jgi:hypothetical protein
VPCSQQPAACMVGRPTKQRHSYLISVCAVLIYRISDIGLAYVESDRGKMHAELLKKVFPELLIQTLDPSLCQTLAALLNSSRVRRTLELLRGRPAGIAAAAAYQHNTAAHTRSAWPPQASRRTVLVLESARVTCPVSCEHAVSPSRGPREQVPVPPRLLSAAATWAGHARE